LILLHHILVKVGMLCLRYSDFAVLIKNILYIHLYLVKMFINFIKNGVVDEITSIW